MSKDYSQLGSPSYEGMREFVVTLNNFDDSQSFYDDMETEGGQITIPNRQCDCYKRRPSSRNTHYMLTYDEAVQVLNDDRVKAVELTPEQRGMKKIPLSWTQTSSEFDKAGAPSGTDINWGLARSLDNDNPSSWGFNATSSLGRTLYAELSGKNVDVVIMDDGIAYPSTLELQQNSDGTGYSRVVSYNWLQHNPEVNGESAGIYNYHIPGDLGPGTGNRVQEHGAHCTGTAAGNTQGWARDANIYGISFSDDPMYVKEFHLKKPINPVTGIRNPTVMNNSWGYRSAAFNLDWTTEVYHRGTTYTPTSGDASTGTAVWDNTIPATAWFQYAGYNVPTQDAALMADFEDLVDAGIIVVVSAGNSQAYQDVPTGPDYDNYYKMYIDEGGASPVLRTFYYHRGSSPGNSPGVITVGAAGRQEGTSPNQVISQEDYRCVFSNFGPGVDVFAAGEHIQSATSGTYSTNPNTNVNEGVVDPRVTALGVSDTENNHFLKIGGTSMSGPQVCGILACLAEKYPRMTTSDALNYIKTFCSEDMVYTLGGYGDQTDLGHSRNTNSAKRYMELHGGRISLASVAINDDPVMHALPSGNYSLYRNTSGQTFPKRQRLISQNKNATFSLSQDNTTMLLGDVTRVTLNTTNIPDGTKVPYIITSSYKGAGESVQVTTGYNLVSDSTNTYTAELYNTTTANEFGTTAVKRRHKINMSAAATTPTFEEDSAGYTAHNPPSSSAATIDIDVSNNASTSYSLSGTDRDGTAFTNAANRHITINKGDTLNLNRTSGSHPLYIKSSLGNGTTGAIGSNYGVTGSGADAIGETVSWNTNDNDVTPGTYYYQCSAHPDMKGFIYVQPASEAPFEMDINHAQWQTGDNYSDDGSWEIDIPWDITIFGTTRNKLYVNSNSFISFGSRYGNYIFSKTVPAVDRIMYMGADGSTPLNYILKKVYGTSPNRYLYIKFEGNSRWDGGGNTIEWECFLYENDTSNIYMQVLTNGRSATATDYYPFRQDEVLGGLDPVGYFTINNNTGYIDIQPSKIPTVGGTGININVRLGIYNSPSLNILCQD